MRLSASYSASSSRDMSESSSYITARDPCLSFVVVGVWRVGRPLAREAWCCTRHNGLPLREPRGLPREDRCDEFSRLTLSAGLGMVASSIYSAKRGFLRLFYDLGTGGTLIDKPGCFRIGVCLVVCDSDSDVATSLDGLAVGVG